MIRKLIQTRVDAKLYARMAKSAKADGLSMAAYVRRWMVHCQDRQDALADGTIGEAVKKWKANQ